MALADETDFVDEDVAAGQMDVTATEERGGIPGLEGQQNVTYGDEGSSPETVYGQPTEPVIFDPENVTKNPTLSDTNFIEDLFGIDVPDWIMDIGMAGIGILSPPAGAALGLIGGAYDLYEAPGKLDKKLGDLFSGKIVETVTEGITTGLGQAFGLPGAVAGAAGSELLQGEMGKPSTVPIEAQLAQAEKDAQARLDDQYGGGDGTAVAGVTAQDGAIESTAAVPMGTGTEGKPYDPYGGLYRKKRRAGQTPPRHIGEFFTGGSYGST